jgi:hypothetical protein
VRNKVLRGALSWPLHSADPNLPLRVFFGGYIKDQFYIPPLLTTLENLKARIRQAVGHVFCEMLESIWQEREYRFDVRRATDGLHIKLCWYAKHFLNFFQ